MKKTIFVFIGGLIILGLILFIRIKDDSVIMEALPEPIVSADMPTAYKKAYKEVGENTSLVEMVVGTGSMSPYIPVSPAGFDPLTTFVAFATHSNKTYCEVEIGDLCVYIVNGQKIIHQAIQKDRGGWIMAGLNNNYYESDRRMTEENFVCVISNVYLWNLQ